MYAIRISYLINRIHPHVAAVHLGQSRITGGTGHGCHGDGLKWLHGIASYRMQKSYKLEERFNMDFKKTIFESCAEVPSMGEAIAAAYECIFESDSTQVQNGGTTEDSLAIDPAAITENPEGAKVLASIADKASQEQQQVEQAQAKLDQTTETAKQTLGELQQELNAKETLGEENQKQVPDTQG